jgi:hypothetical protein
MKTDYVTEAVRQTPVYRTVDVVVIGGGPAGLMAAVAAAREGASTIIVEKNGYLGGMATSGMVLTLGGIHSWTPSCDQVVKGIPSEFIARLRRQGKMRSQNGVVLDFDPESFKILADEMILEAGVVPLFHALGVEPLMDKKCVKGVIIESKSGRFALRSSVVIDATGDADIAYRAGVPCQKSKTLQPATMCFMLGGVTQYVPSRQNTRELTELGDETPPPPYEPDILGNELDEWRQLRWALQNPLESTPPNRLLRKRMDQAKDRKEISPFGGPWGMGLYVDEIWFNTTRQYVDATDVESLTRGEINGRRQVQEIINYWRQHIKGFGHSRLRQTASQLGIRETRRIVGECILGAEQIVEEYRGSDSIALGCWPIDVHPAPDGSYKGQNLNHVGFHPQQPYGIPYGCLVPLNVDGLLVAGRCIATTREGQGSIRVMGTCMALGQAAGTAAALAAQAALLPRKLNPERIRARLIERNAIVDLAISNS